MSLEEREKSSVTPGGRRRERGPPALGARGSGPVPPPRTPVGPQGNARQPTTLAELDFGLRKVNLKRQMEIYF